MEEIHKLNNNFSKLESKLSQTKQVNSLLSRRLLNMERQSWAKAHCAIRECLEIVGIPTEVEADVLEEKVEGKKTFSRS